MTGSELKALVAQIPDEANVGVAGPDSGGYEWMFCQSAKVTRDGLGWYYVTGTGDDVMDVMVTGDEVDTDTGDKEG